MKKFLAVLTAVAVLAPAAAFASVDLTLLGGSVTVPQGQSYVEPGFSAFSTVDGDITSNVFVTNPGTSRTGTFSIEYSVTDSALDSASASRSLTVTGGAGMIFCSGPLAPGWNASLPNGGCGGTQTLFAFNRPIPDGTVCPFFWGCMIKQ